MTAAERFSVFMRSLFLQAAFGPERMQALGFAWALDPWLVKVWGADARALAEARRRHHGCFNTNPYAAGFVLGMTARLEEEAAAMSEPERPAKLARMTQLKAAASAGMAGAADAFFWGALRPALAAAALFLGFVFYRFGLRAWAVLPAGLYLLAWNAPALMTRWRGVERGYRGGEGGVLDVCKMPVAQAAVTLRFTALGLGLAATMAALYSSALHENARLWGGVAMVAAALAPERLGPWGVAGAMGLVRAVWESGL